jgi:hypothetical protein
VAGGAGGGVGGCLVAGCGLVGGVWRLRSGRVGGLGCGLGREVGMLSGVESVRAGRLVAWKKALLGRNDPW